MENGFLTTKDIEWKPKNISDEENIEKADVS